MNTTDVKLQLPMNKQLRDELSHKAGELGFDSAQALLRYMAKAVVDGRQVTFGEDEWGQPTPEAAERINRAAEEAKRDIAAGKLKAYYTVEEAMGHLRNL